MCGAQNALLVAGVESGADHPGKQPSNQIKYQEHLHNDPVVLLQEQILETFSHSIVEDKSPQLLSGDGN